MNDNLIVDKTKQFAIRIVNLYKFLCDEKHEYVLSKQLLRSGTSIGANVREGIRGQSTSDFGMKMNIALKEASETEYWLEILHETGFLTEQQFSSIYADCVEVNMTSSAIDSKITSINDERSKLVQPMDFNIDS